MREEFTGPLASVIWRIMADLTASFEQFANGPRGRSEQEARTLVTGR